MGFIVKPESKVSLCFFFMSHQLVFCKIFVADASGDALPRHHFLFLLASQ